MDSGRLRNDTAHSRHKNDKGALTCRHVFTSAHFTTPMWTITVIPAKKLQDGTKMAGRRATSLLGVGEAKPYTRLIIVGMTSTQNKIGYATRGIGVV